MEPVSAHSPIPAANRPALSLSANLAAVLQEGRVLAGQVLQTFGGGSVLIGVGELRIPAQSPIELALGDRLLFEVVERNGRLELVVVDDGDGARDSALVKTVREGLTRGRSVAELLQQLGGNSEASDRGGSTSELGRRLANWVLPKEPTGSEVARALERSGLGHESALLESALAQASPSRRRELVWAVWNELREALVASEKTPRPAAGQRAQQASNELDEQVRTALRERAAELGTRPSEEPARDVLRRLARELDSLVRAVLRRRSSASQPPAPTGSEPPQRADSKALRWSASMPLREAVVRELLGAAPTPTEQAARPESLKLWLLEALASFQKGGESGLGEQVARTLARLEADQLLNLVRADAGEPQHMALPIPDDGGWTMLHLYRHPPRSEGGEAPDGESRRVTIELELRALGPLRADVVLGGHGLTMRVTTPRPDVHAKLEAAAAELTERLEALHGTANLVVRLAPDEAFGSDELESVRFLQDRHLMDRSA